MKTGSDYLKHFRNKSSHGLQPSGSTCLIDFRPIPDCSSICRIITRSILCRERNISWNYLHPGPLCLSGKKQDALRNRPCLGDRIYYRYGMQKRAGIGWCLVCAYKWNQCKWKNGFNFHPVTGEACGYFHKDWKSIAKTAIEISVRKILMYY